MMVLECAVTLVGIVTSGCRSWNSTTCFHVVFEIVPVSISTFISPCI